ncbi:hypothetical protein QNO08_09470 [Arthrobacter sp. zg-Y820]|uniref:hypothetical protein n=1 Tax=unclassified Arthrobacter TaxID=235627 RepID=UPI001E31721E|nr:MULTISPECIES: hypothetical protein [unclassified Arthrobacter]MCC9196654.1 hypothetical protein [Arthrobacter sp. zg-Y820]MDK1279516.1 hypothetical protein [Arthrobacter sp. zg.Y820]WIB08107.1 hypothetical protein QNO08_09470 [Arthrobacter sp. zg-Y820]
MANQQRAHPGGTGTGSTRSGDGTAPADAGAPHRNRNNLLSTMAGLVFCGVSLWSLLGNLVDPHYGVSRYETSWALAAAAVVLLLMAGLYLGLRKAEPHLLRHPIPGRLASAAVWMALFALQVRLSCAVRLPADWDSHPMFVSATGLALGTRTEIDSGYFSLNPNNILLTLLLSVYFGLVVSLGVTDLEVAAAFLNAVVLFAGIALTYAAARMLGGRTVAAFTLLPSTIFVLLSPWLGVLYSDTTGLVFPVLILCLLLASQRSRRLAGRVALWILAGGAGAVGYGVKPTVIICLLAAGITAACSPVLRGRGRSAGTLLLGAAVVAGSVMAGHRILEFLEQRTTAIGFDVEDNPAAIPPTHFLKVGSQSRQGPHGLLYGCFNNEDYWSTVNIADPDERFQQGLHVYAERVSAMGPAGYADFLNHKLLWVTGDGSFFSWGEGVRTGDEFVSTAPADRGIQDMYGNNRPGFPWLLSLWQGAWFVVLALVAVPLVFRTPRLLLPEVSAVRIALLGLLLFLLLSEGRARLLYLYVPYFILLASLSFQAVADSLLPARVLRGPRGGQRAEFRSGT